ncbi:MAG: ABC transporter permease [Saprospiraceae bacterium]|nr:ABC transporter permease [Saprospiraceae bacterium]
MFQIHFNMALRRLFKNKVFSLINISGLSLGIAVSLLLWQYIHQERSYDQFHTDHERIFRVTTHWGDDPQSDIYATTPPPLRDAIQAEVPEVEQVARVFKWNDSTMRLPKEDTEGKEVFFRETKIYIADPNFLEVMDFNIIQGDKSAALEELESLVLTKETAMRYFGKDAVDNKEVIGRTILFGGNRTARKVTAIVDPPTNSHIDFDMLVNANFGYKGIIEQNNWAWNVMHTYAKVNSQVIGSEQRLNNLQDKLNGIADTQGRAFMQTTEHGRLPGESLFEYRLQPLSSIHLNSNYVREHQANGNATVVGILATVAWLILLLACINFMNLSTAQASKRAKEVGIRKTLGAARGYLVSQFLMESLAYSLIAGVVAFGLVEIFRGPFALISGREIAADWFMQPWLWQSSLLLLVLVGVLSGSYPAFFLSSFKPIEVFKGKLGLGKGGAPGFRNALVVFQFVISIGLIISTLLVGQQMSHVRSNQQGYNKENVLVIDNDKEVREQWESFKGSLLGETSVLEASFSTGVPFQPYKDMRDFRLEGSNKSQGITWMRADDTYEDALGLELIAGRAFDRNMGTDSTGLILNESAVKVLGLEDPIGKIIIKNAGAPDEERLQLIGIVRDFSFESYYNDIKPLAIQNYFPNFQRDYISIRLAAGKAEEGLAAVQAIWDRYQPGDPMVYSFMDQDFDALFRTDQRLGRTLSMFTILAILIACLGLFGLSTFNTERRAREIGIRKVLGASAGQIVQLLSKEFTLLVGIALLIAAPLSYYFIAQWLTTFPIQMTIPIWVFLLAGLGAISLAWLTVGLQSFQVATADPVDSLKEE